MNTKCALFERVLLAGFAILFHPNALCVSLKRSKEQERSPARLTKGISKVIARGIRSILSLSPTAPYTHAHTQPPAHTFVELNTSKILETIFVRFFPITER